MPQDLTDDKSTLDQVMAWCRQATSHYLSQCWPSSMLPYGVTRPQWVNISVSYQPIRMGFMWLSWWYRFRKIEKFLYTFIQKKYFCGAFNSLWLCDTYLSLNWVILGFWLMTCCLFGTKQYWNSADLILEKKTSVKFESKYSSFQPRYYSKWLLNHVMSAILFMPQW